MTNYVVAPCPKRESASLPPVRIAVVVPCTHLYYFAIALIMPLKIKP